MSETSVLIVCLGNICRSPIGEAVLKHIASKRGVSIEVDSAGTAAYHIGESPDSRAQAACRQEKVPMNHKARQVSAADFTRFDYILAADEKNLSNLKRIAPKNSTASVKLWGFYLDGKPIQDPYYGDDAGFNATLNQCVELSTAFLDEVLGKETGYTLEPRGF